MLLISKYLTNKQRSTILISINTYWIKKGFLQKHLSYSNLDNLTVIYYKVPFKGQRNDLCDKINDL